MSTYKLYQHSPEMRMVLGEAKRKAQEREKKQRSREWFNALRARKAQEQRT